MDRLETLLAETLVERADGAPTGPLPLSDRAARRRVAAAAVAGAVAAVGVAVLVASILTRQPSRHPQPDRAGTSTVPVARIPASQRIAAYGPVSLRVRSTLPTRTSLCGGPVSQQVVAETSASMTSSCPRVADQLAPHPGTVIWFSRWFSRANSTSPYATIATTGIRIDGHQARLGYATHRARLGSGVSAVVRIPDSGVTVGITAPNREQIDTMLSTLRIAAINPVGCAFTHASAVKTAAGSAEQLVRHGATAAVRCEYDPATGRLIATDLYRQDTTRQLTAALNALVPDPCHCPHGGTPAPSHGEAVYFHFRDGSTQRISGAVGANLDTWTNGKRTVANFSSSMTELLDRLANRP